MLAGFDWNAAEANSNEHHNICFSFLPKDIKMKLTHLNKDLCNLVKQKRGIPFYLSSVVNLEKENFPP